jgi:hypothetical protein
MFRVGDLVFYKGIIPKRKGDRDHFLNPGIVMDVKEETFFEELDVDNINKFTDTVVTVFWTKNKKTCSYSEHDLVHQIVKD